MHNPMQGIIVYFSDMFYNHFVIMNYEVETRAKRRQDIRHITVHYRTLRRDTCVLLHSSRNELPLHVHCM